MFNYTSPIVNNILGGNQIPPNPIINFGAINYNQGGGYVDPVSRPPQYQQQYPNNMMMGSSYYNNIYNGYYNPYLAQKQQELREIEEKEQARRVANIWKRMSRACNEALHIDIEDWDEHLKQYDPVFETKTPERSGIRVKLIREDEVICDPEKFGYYNRVIYKQDEDSITSNLIRITATGIPYNYQLAMRVEYNNRIYEQSKAKFGDNMGLAEYLDKAGELYSEALVSKYMERRNNMKNIYDSSDFKKLLQQNGSGDGYFSTTFARQEISPGLFTGPTLGSLEVTVPEHLGRKYDEVRQRFMQSILNNSGGGA